ncbi:thiol reductant ABC exporter subunit CydD [Caulobacter sp. DWR1-3-2b1]|uniref:thiol reductant ABC exporter subunit CydD n=1 Tax=Caulobacter sp. DWR1-3-2b1 TaxID=2804670 RepID=UPI003CF83DDB
MQARPSLIAGHTLVTARLKDLARFGASPLRRARTLILLDGAAATAFAAALACAIDALATGKEFRGWLVLLVVATVARGVMTKLAGEAGARAAALVKTIARSDTASALAARKPGGGLSSGDATTAVVEGVEALDGHVSRFLPARFAAAATPLALIAVAALASPIAAAILLGALLPFIIAMALAGTAAAAESRAQFTALERLSGLFLDRVRALPVVLAFQAEQRITRDLARSADELANRTIRVLRVAFFSSGALEFFAALSVALVAVYCGFNLLRLLPFPVPEQLDLKRAFFVLALAPEIYLPMRRLAAAYHDRQAAEAATASLIALPRPEQRPAAPVFTAPPTIRFSGVTIRYPNADAPVLEGFDLEVPAGKIVALLGPSGSGKTSLLNLLLDLAPLTAGAVLIDGRPLAELGALSGQVAWAGQHPLITPGSIADNIALAHRDATHAQIDAAAERVGLSGALAIRPGGLDAWLDERGSGLSGGERRRMSLARAILKPAPILLMDEPTANLDAGAEADLLAAIRETARGRTTLIATHSEALANLADHVVRLT